MEFCPGYSEFLFPEFLDYTGNQAEVETQLAERVFIHNNTVWGTVGFAPCQQAMDESATVPTNQIPTRYSTVTNYKIQVFAKLKQDHKRFRQI